MNVNLKLIILHVDLQTLANGCLLENDVLISRPLLNSDISGGLRDILVECLEIRPEWVRFNLIDVIQEESNVSIVYSCLIPSILQNLKGKWTQLGEINDKQIKKLVFQASQTGRC